MLWLQRSVLIFFGKVTNEVGWVSPVFLTAEQDLPQQMLPTVSKISACSNFPTSLANLIPLGMPHSNLFLMFLLCLDYWGHCILFSFRALQAWKKSAQINSLWSREGIVTLMNTKGFCCSVQQCHFLFRPSSFSHLSGLLGIVTPLGTIKVGLSSYNQDW